VRPGLAAGLRLRARVVVLLATVCLSPPP